jgi:hypothetical protein
MLKWSMEVCDCSEFTVGDVYGEMVCFGWKLNSAKMSVSVEGTNAPKI